MNLFIKVILAFLILFTPFAFAGAEPWGFTVMQIGIIASAVAWVLFNPGAVVITRQAKPVLFIFLFLILLGAVQTFFPQTLLSAPPGYPVTLMRLFTLEHISMLITHGALAGLVSQIFPSQNHIKYLLAWIIFCVLAVAICANSFTRGEYIYYFTGVRGGIGPFLNRNHAAVFLGLGAISTLGWLFFRQTSPDRYRMHRQQRHRFYVEQMCGWLVFTGLFLSVIFTRSRGGILSTLAGIFCFAFLMTGLLPKKSRDKLKGVALTGICCAGTTYWILTHIEWINAFAYRAKDYSAEIRVMLYHAALDLLGQFPLWGIGLGAMPVALPPYFSFSLNRYVEHLHNDWLELALGVGYAGSAVVACALLGFIFLLCWRMNQLPRHKLAIFCAACSGLFAMSVGSTVDFHFFIPANALLFFILLGIVCAPTFDKHHLTSLRLPVLVRVCLAIILSASIYIPLQKTMAWRCVLFGKGLKQEAKLEQYHRALDYFPAPRYAVNLGNSYFNASLHAKDPQEKDALRQEAFEIAHTYLKQYPKEPALSKLYVRTRPKK